MLDTFGVKQRDSNGKPRMGKRGEWVLVSLLYSYSILGVPHLGSPIRVYLPGSFDKEDLNQNASVPAGRSPFPTDTVALDETRSERKAISLASLLSPPPGFEMPIDGPRNLDVFERPTQPKYG